MRLSELRCCDGCGKPLFVPPSRCFHVVRVRGAVVTPAALETARAAARQGVPLERLEAGSPGDVAALTEHELQLCVDCYLDRPVAEIVRRRVELQETLVGRGGGRPL